MDDERFEELLRVAAEIEALDDPGARSTLGTQCLPFARCADLARAHDTATEAERAHLRSCVPCATRLGAFARVRAPHPADPPTAQPRPLRRFWPFALALAAALVVLARLVLSPSAERPQAYDVRVALAPTAEDLFHTPRGTGVDEEFYIGVELDRTGDVTLVFVDDLGRAHVMPLDPGGSESARVVAGTVRSFGGYRRHWIAQRAGEERTLVHVLVAVAEEPLAVDELRAALEDLAPIEPDAIDRARQELAARFRCSVAVLPVP